MNKMNEKRSKKLYKSLSGGKDTITNVTTDPKFLEDITDDMFPMPVFSYGHWSILATLISWRKGGMYNHFMWLINQNELVTQFWTFKKVPVEDYMKQHRLKFMYATKWTIDERKAMIKSMEKDLVKPWYRRRYDFLAIFGHAVGLSALHVPWADICSERAKYIKLSASDSDYNLKNPSPTDVNKWMKKKPDRYEPYMIFMPELF